MTRRRSTEDVIRKAAADLAESLTRVLRKAKKEEEIRIATERVIGNLAKEANIELEGKHEFTVASGRVDSVYDRVIVEYKNPYSPSASIGTTLKTGGSQSLVEQIQRRFKDLTEDFGHEAESLLGVGLDGRRFIFVRYRHGGWRVDEPVDVNPFSCERFIWALFNLGTKGRPYYPAELAADFGSKSVVATKGVQALYSAITSVPGDRTIVFLNEWKILFSEVCGFDVKNPSAKIHELADMYGIPRKGLRVAELLFVIHTYYAVFMKLLASEVMAFFHDLDTPLKRLQAAGSSKRFRAELDDLEDGGLFRQLGIVNFLEGDLFSWYTGEWSPAVEEFLRALVAELDKYNPGTLSEDPTARRDLLKLLYQELFPRAVRHDLGEYYTPDWLAEKVLNEVGYTGEPDSRLLDPACGSGTFLVLAIARIRAQLESKGDTADKLRKECLEKILTNIVGFDLNPLAVMAARTNYLIAIHDLLDGVDRVEIPVFLSDAVLVPHEYGDLFSGGGATIRQIETSVGVFNIPTAVAEDRSKVSRYAELLEHGIFNDYAAEDFVELCKKEELAPNEEKLNRDLFDQMVALEKANKNGVWARFIKNAFAPLFVAQFDFVVGNPPWVNWESLPKNYRAATASLWTAYDLFRHKGYSAKLGGAKDDISVLLTYVAHDRYLRDGGTIGFVITQTVFKTKGGGDGFRALAYGDKAQRRHLSPIRVHDFSSFQPFDGANNRTAIFVAGKSNVPVKYPVPYTFWAKTRGAKIETSSSWSDVESQLESENLGASPVSSTDRRSPWITAPTTALAAMKKVAGITADYRARKGVYCATNAVFWVDKNKAVGKSKSLVTNLADTGKKRVKKVTVRVENDYLYPLVRGRDVERWGWTARTSILLPQDLTNPSKAVPEDELKVHAPDTYAYFHSYESTLRSCALLKQFFDPAVAPFYSSYNIGDYTFAAHKVVWKEIAKDIEATVISLTSGKMPIVDHKLVMVACSSEDEAHYLCAVLNSAPIRVMVRSYAIQTSISGHIFDYARIPKFSKTSSLHRSLAAASRKCHKQRVAEDLQKLAKSEETLDGLVANLWSIPKGELQKVRKLLY